MPDGDLVPIGAAQAPPVLPAAEMLAASEGYLAAFRTAPPRLAEAAMAWLENIRPPQWALEWSLPFWLGETLGLPREATRRLVLSNVIGLAFVRLQDALADGETPQIGPALAPPLSTLIYQRWMQEYRGLCDTPRFWMYFDGYLAEWLAATIAGDESPVHAFQEFGEEDFLHLAHRGAPLKVCVAAACLLAGREQDLPGVGRCHRSLLVGAVLLDHAHDWTDDLAAGRYNAFVASISPLPQTPQHREANVPRGAAGDLSRRGCPTLLPDRSQSLSGGVQIGAARRLRRIAALPGLARSADGSVQPTPGQQRGCTP